MILAIFDHEKPFTVLELFACANHPPLNYCPAIGRHNMARIRDEEVPLDRNGRKARSLWPERNGNQFNGDPII